jgi:hypothetical protein
LPASGGLARLQRDFEATNGQILMLLLKNIFINISIYLGVISIRRSREGGNPGNFELGTGSARE